MSFHTRLHWEVQEDVGREVSPQGATQGRRDSSRVKLKLPTSGRMRLGGWRGAQPGPSTCLWDYRAGTHLLQSMISLSFRPRGRI